MVCLSLRMLLLETITLVLSLPSNIHMFTKEIKENESKPTSYFRFVQEQPGPDPRWARCAASDRGTTKSQTLAEVWEFLPEWCFLSFIKHVSSDTPVNMEQ